MKGKSCTLVSLKFLLQMFLPFQESFVLIIWLKKPLCLLCYDKLSMLVLRYAEHTHVTPRFNSM